MINLSSLARPYAKAAFEAARDANALDAWKAFLSSAALIAKNAQVQRALATPETSTEQVLGFFESVLAATLDEKRKHFLALLAEKQRFVLLPKISEQFDRLLATEAKIGTAKVTTAVEVDEAYRDTLAAALSKRTQRKISVQCQTDPSIIGGAIIHLDDHVIDASIRGKLTRLLEFSLR